MQFPRKMQALRLSSCATQLSNKERPNEFIPEAVCSMSAIRRCSELGPNMRDEWNATYPAYRRSFELGNITSTKPILVQFASPPVVACRFTIQPDTALAEASLKLVTYRAGQEIMAHCEGPPLPSACVAREFPGGTYLIQASHSSGPPQFQQLAVILPPSFVQKVIFG